MNSKNRVKEGLKPVPFTHGVLDAGLKLGLGMIGSAPERALGQENAGHGPAGRPGRRSKRSM